jgi:hypothetical protein
MEEKDVAVGSDANVRGLGVGAVRSGLKIAE